MHNYNFSPTLDWLNKQLTCTKFNIVFKVREVLGGWAASGRLKFGWDWRHRVGGRGGWERDLLLPSHHQQVGEKERNKLNIGLSLQLRHQHTFSFWSGFGEEGRGGEEGAKDWGEEETRGAVEKSNRAEGLKWGRKCEWLPTTLWYRTGAGVEGLGGLWKVWQAALISCGLREI